MTRASLTATYLAAVFLAAAQPAWAINRCTGPGGQVSYQDAPCVAGTGTAIQVRPASGHAQPAASTASDPAAPKPMTEADRLNKMSDQSAKERRLRQLQTLDVPNARARIDQHRAACAREQRALENDQYRYVQNLYGKTHAAQRASEMAAAAATCDTQDRELNKTLDALVKECQELGGCK